MAEITFNNPEYLWFLLSIPLLIVAHFYLLRKSKKKAMKFANFETLKRVTGKKLLTKNISLLVLRTLILLVVILSVSGSIFWYQGEINKNDFVIAIDASASMTSEDLFPSRMEAAKTQAIKFVDSLKSNSKVGLLTFSGYTFIGEAPTKNHEKIKGKIEEIEIAPAAGTDIPGAIVTAANLLSDADRGKTLIIISDGSNTIGTFIDDSLKQSVGYAQDSHLTIHSIGTGRDTENPIGYLPEYYNISSVFNEDNMKYMSNMTGGEYYHAADNELLTEAFKDIAEQQDIAWLDIQLSFPLMLIALVLIFIEWGLINTKFRKIP